MIDPAEEIARKLLDPAGLELVSFRRLPNDDWSIDVKRVKEFPDAPPEWGAGPRKGKKR